MRIIDKRELAESKTNFIDITIGRAFMNYDQELCFKVNAYWAIEIATSRQFDSSNDDKYQMVDVEITIIKNIEERPNG